MSAPDRSEHSKIHPDPGFSQQLPEDFFNEVDRVLEEMKS
jgi:hypothetical protein